MTAPLGWLMPDTFQDACQFYEAAPRRWCFSPIDLLFNIKNYHRSKTGRNCQNLVHPLLYPVLLSFIKMDNQ
jgi:hypothetical protein